MVAWVLVVAVPVHAASPDASMDGDRLTASLLGEDDLPGFVGRDLGGASELDIDRLAFDEHRGTRVATRAWVSQEAGVVFDQRMLFPTEEAALGYLVAAEPTLSEADDAGLALVLDDPLTPATRHWAGETVISGEPVAMDVWLIPVGPVVAKLSATVFGPGLALRRALAERALERLVAGYGPADAVWPTGSAAPGDPPDASYSDLESLRRLTEIVLRVGLRDCEGIAVGLAGEVAATSCTRDGAVVVYRMFSDVAARDAAVASLLEEAPAPDASASSCREGAFRGDVTDAGRTWSVACWTSSSGAVVLWSEPAEPIVGAILAPDGVDPVATWEAVRLPDRAPLPAAPLESPPSHADTPSTR
jgi:hypothetical protein